MLTTRRDWVPGMRTKWTMRFEPPPSANESDPSGWSEPITFSATADNSGKVSSGRPIMLAWSAGAARTTPAPSTSTAETPGRLPRLLMIFDIQSRFMPATTIASSSRLIADTG